MPLYAVIGIDHPPHSMELRQQHRAAHREFSQSHTDITRLAGALYDAEGHQCGTLKLFEADSPEHIRAIYRDDPFLNNGVYRDFHVIEWRMALNSLAPTDGWVKDYPTGAKA